MASINRFFFRSPTTRSTTSSQPGGTSADLSVETGEDDGSGGIPLTLSGHAAVGGTSIDSIRIAAVIPAEAADPYRADLLVDAYGVRVMTDASVRVDDGLDLTLERPGAARPADTGAVYLAGRMSVDSETGTISVDDLHTEGMFGRVLVSAEIDSTMSGTFRIAGEWPDPPGRVKGSLWLSPRPGPFARPFCARGGRGGVCAAGCSTA